MPSHDTFFVGWSNMPQYCSTEVRNLSQNILHPGLSSPMYIYKYTHIYTYACVCVYVCMCWYAYIYIYICIHSSMCVYTYMYIILYIHAYIYIILLYINDTGFNSPTREWLIWYASAPVELSFSLLYQLFSEKHGSPDGQIRWNGHWIDSRDTEEQGRLVAHAFLRSLSLYALMSISYVCRYIIYIYVCTYGGFLK